MTYRVAATERPPDCRDSDLSFRIDASPPGNSGNLPDADFSSARAKIAESSGPPSRSMKNFPSAAACF